MDNEECLEIMRKWKLNTIKYEYEAYSPISNELFVWCYLTRLYFQSNPVMSLGKSSESSLGQATKLLSEVIALEKLTKIPIPPLEKQPYKNGYYREMVFQDYEVEFKNKDGVFYITSIRRKDSEGFYYVESPFPISPEYKFIEHSKEGDVYKWDNIGPLCGSRGLLIVKDGMVIKQKMTAIS